MAGHSLLTRIQCDRSRPACSKCIHRGLECTYLDVITTSPGGPGQLEKLASYLNSEPAVIVDLLTTLPYFEAFELFNMLREMPRDGETSVASETQNPSIPLASLQPQNLIKSLLPSNPMEQELMVRHPIAYPVLLPMGVGDLPLEQLTSRRPGMTATKVLRDTASLSSADPISTDDEGLDEDVLIEFLQGLPHLSQLHIEYLRKVNLTLWMDLPIPNETAVRVIALYLNNDYPVLPLFHADLFLRDLCQNQPYFCSALLISALLGWACVGIPVDKLLPLTLTIYFGSKLVPASIQKQLPGALSFSPMLRADGVSSILMSPSQSATYLPCSS